jgi:hypothetical protein
MRFAVSTSRADEGRRSVAAGGATDIAVVGRGRLGFAGVPAPARGERWRGLALGAGTGVVAAAGAAFAHPFGDHAEDALRPPPTASRTGDPWASRGTDFHRERLHRHWPGVGGWCSASSSGGVGADQPRVGADIPRTMAGPAGRRIGPLQRLDLPRRELELQRDR